MYVPRKKPGKKYITMHIVSTYEAVKSIEIILSILSFFKSSKFSTVFYIAFIHKKNYQLFLKSTGNYDQVCTIRFQKQKYNFKLLKK